MSNTEKKPAVKKKKKKKFNGKKLLVWMLAASAFAVVLAFAGYLFIIANGQNELAEGADKFNMDEAAHVYDVNGDEVTTLARVNREIVEFSEIPEKLRNAFIATEDRRFNEHSGVDLYSLGRAVVKDVIARSAVEGGSTITQQLAKNLFLNADKTFFRKATEVSIAIALERNFTKDEILKMYLNRIYFGSGAYGVKAAAKVYFGVSDLSALKTWQIATLAAIPKAPSHYSPIDNPEKSKERRAVVLRLMTDQGYITEEERKEAVDVDYERPVQNDQKQYLTFLDYVVKEATEKFEIEEDKLLREGYKIYTTMDSNAQRILEETYNNPKMFQGDGPSQKIQSGMAIVNNKDGGIVAMIGGRDYVRKGLNRATVARQPGSSFKPLVVYAPAIESGKYTPYSMLKDEKQDFNGYSPNNYDNVYRGQVTMTEAVKRSINLPAVWLLKEIGLSKGIQFAKNMGIPFDEKDSNLAIALGGMTRGVSPLQMASAYSAFANNGAQYATHSIVKIVKPNGETLNYKQDKPKQVMSAKTAYYMTEMMKTVVETGGTGVKAKFNRPLAGKTGSTQLDLKGFEKYDRDVWFVGYTPEWSAAVWEGFDKTDTKHYVTVGSGSTAAIFKEVMSKAMAKMPVTNFSKPEGVAPPEEPKAPDAITGFKVEYIREKKAVRLTWNPAADNMQYRIYRKSSKEADYSMHYEVKLPELDDIAMPGETYSYYVTAYNPDTKTESPPTDKLEITVPKDGGAESPTPSPSMSPGGSGSPVPSGSPGATPKPSDGKTPKPSPGTSGSPGGSPSPGGGSSPPTSVEAGKGSAVPRVGTPVNGKEQGVNGAVAEDDGPGH
ncbi:transglycosylase domain-containing protein [Paenibacillus contaminans]|uniref:Penicillin-binding protein n=1 Tax=Paenibacillus contaminans TaxID=450362 RepID=A0A329MKU2_9BACL|nr:penicillin-binding protein 1A [Paenibacillus contaminans]RAV20541.1 penicillin-binding protein [Paenibacillus contaminans]